MTQRSSWWGCTKEESVATEYTIEKVNGMVREIRGFGFEWFQYSFQNETVIKRTEVNYTDDELKYKTNGRLIDLTENGIGKIITEIISRVQFEEAIIWKNSREVYLRFYT